MDRTGALRAQDTSPTNCSGGLVFDPATNVIERERCQAFAGRTPIDIVLGIVSKSFFSKQPLIMSAAYFASGISHVGCDPAFLTGHEVLTRAILAIGYHYLRLAFSVLLVLRNQAHQFFVLRDCA